MAAADERMAKLAGVVESLNTAKFAAPTMPLKEVLEKMDRKDPALVLLDVRSEEERAVSTIPGAISKAEFEKAPEAYAGKEVVAFCTVGYLSGAYVCEMNRKGCALKNFGDGALLAYTLAGKPLTKPDGSPSDSVHTFMEGLAGLAGDGLKTTAFKDPDAVLAAANARIKEVLDL